VQKALYTSNAFFILQWDAKKRKLLIKAILTKSVATDFIHSKIPNFLRTYREYLFDYMDCNLSLNKIYTFKTRGLPKLKKRHFIFYHLIWPNIWLSSAKLAEDLYHYTGGVLRRLSKGYSWNIGTRYKEGTSHYSRSAGDGTKVVVTKIH